MNKKLYKMMDWAEIETVVYSEEDHPHDFLGAHYVSGGILIQAFFPDVKKVYAIVKMNDVIKEYPMELADEEGFYAVLVKSLTKAKYSYHFKVLMKNNTFIEIEDPYRFPSTVKQSDIEKFNAGIHYTIYDVLGAQVRKINGVAGTSFAVWAPNALRVSVVGNFNHWDGRIHQMRRLGESGIFEIFIPGISDGEIYKYELKLKGGMISLKADPYGFGAELRPGTASVVRNIKNHCWSDEQWLMDRKTGQSGMRPMIVYEVHLGSFKKPEDTREFYNYRELAPMLAEYV
ncbi:MAG TPA: 1,4-alpha-glucan branching enzyme, partial [Lachnospiraceae bacterium]|nr:1,4-alpha-glucan branching enzyme [Lachnospiraceae bacterium]